MIFTDSSYNIFYKIEEKLFKLQYNDNMYVLIKYLKNKLFLN